MFGIGTKKPAQPEKKKRSHDLSQFGLFDAPTNLNDGPDDGDDNDSDLEAELAAITAGTARARPAPRKPVIPAVDLDRMVADSLRDDHDDDDDDVDENDPELLSELQGITVGTPTTDADDAQLLPFSDPLTTPNSVNMVDLLNGRMEQYRVAESNARTAGDAGKVRRIGRGLKTLADLLKQAKAGRTVSMDDVPPEMSVKASASPAAPAPTVQPAVPSRSAPAPPTIVAPAAPVIAPVVAPQPPTLPDNEPTDKLVDANASVDNSANLRLLNERKRAFQVAALMAKKAGDIDTAKQMVRILMQFDLVIAEAMAGRPVDLSAMPDAPTMTTTSATAGGAAAAVAAVAAGTSPPEGRREEAEHQNDAPAAETVKPAPQLPPPAAPTTVAEALQQRLTKYQSVEEAAKVEGNTSKARRYGRIIKQYQDAIKLHRLGKPVPFDELPTPPGFGPIPGVAPTPIPTTVIGPEIGNDDEAPPAATLPPTPKPRVEPAAAADVKPQPKLPLPPSRLSGNHSNTALMQQNIQMLAERQAAFRRAAVEAKQAGNLPAAKEYLRQFKQLEQLLEVARGGMPVDLSTVPLAPGQRAQLEDSFTMVSEADCVAGPIGSGGGGELGDISARLEHQLMQQLAMCRQTRDHHRAMGDVAGTNRFENLALSVQKDADLVKFARSQNLAVPKFHYEKRRFDIVRCNTDLADTELEISVVRGIGYSVSNPKDVDTYVKLEVPLPSAEQPFRTRTQLIRDTDSPTYDEKFIVEIAPKQRQCQRVFKRHAVKLEVFSKGTDWWLGRMCDRLMWLCCYSGFLRSDVLIGTVTVKLAPLETVCEVHDSFDLMDGRKTNGGKLEVKLRTRNPLLTTQIQHTEEKWLIIDS